MKRFVFIILLLMMGCSQGTQVEDLAISLSMGIDKEEQGTTLTTEYLDIEKASDQKKGESHQYVLESVTDKNISTALMKLKHMNPKEVIRFHNKAVIFGKEMLQSGIMNSVSELTRSNSIRGGTLIVAAKENAHKLLNSSSVEAQSLSEAIVKLVNRHGIHTTAVDLLYDGMGVPQGGALSVLDIIESEGRKLLVVSGAAILEQGKLKGYLDNEEVGLLKILLNQKSTRLIAVMYKGHSIEFIVQHSHLKLFSTITNNKPQLRYVGRVSFNVYKEEGRNLITPEDIAKVERLVADKFEISLNQLLKKVNSEYQVDVLGLGIHLYRYHPSYWKSNHEEWENNLPNIDVSFQPDIRIMNVELHS